jgi:quercetin dioxygenase-like cupin family protein
MFHIVHREEQQSGALAAVQFEGDSYGSDVSFFLGNLPPGKGPGLHTHPYSETCIVMSGKAAMTVDGADVLAGAGDIVVIGPETPHRFAAAGDKRLDMVCIHASDRFVIDWLDD